MNILIENVPDRLVHRLQTRADRHHRSLQDELLVIIEAAVVDETALTPFEILAEVRRLGISPSSEAAALIRADRDRNRYHP